VGNVTAPTATYSTTEVLTAINYGYGKIVRAVRSVNPQNFLTYYDNFSLTVGESEYDLSAFDPPVWRPIKLVVPKIPANNVGTETVVLFEYRDFRSQDFGEREGSARGAFNVFYYDIMQGRIPQRNAADPTAAGNAQIVSSPGVTQFLVLDTISGGINEGQLVRVPLMGPKHLTSVETDYWGTVIAVTSGGGNYTVTVAPDMTTQPSGDEWIQLFRTSVLMVAPSPSTAMTGRLYYLYAPAKLVADNDVLDMIASAHRDSIVAYAASWLLRSTNDDQAERWFLEAQEMRSELMQDIDPVGGQNSTGLGSGLHGLVGDQ
jgi:hypothetical protein